MSWELELLLWIQHHLSFSWLKPFMAAVSFLGNFGLIWLLLCAYIGLIKKDKKVCLVMLGALILTTVVSSLVIKPLFMRARPFEVYPYVDLLIPAPQDFSFPSGHTASSFAAAFVYWYFYRKKSVWVWLLAGMIAFSRLFLFVHFPTDILGGIVLGLGCGYFMSTLYQSRRA